MYWGAPTELKHSTNFCALPEVYSDGFRIDEFNDKNDGAIFQA
jgi:hypothetical protein